MKLFLPLLVLGVASCTGPSYSEAQNTRNHLRAVAKEHVNGGQAGQGPTGMWKVEYAGRVHRWLIALDGDHLYIEPALQSAAFAFDYFVGKRTDAAKPRTWTIQHHVVRDASFNAGIVSPNVGTMTFDADYRVMQAEWPNIRTRGAGLLDVLQDAIESTDILARGTRGPWPNL